MPIRLLAFMMMFASVHARTAIATDISLPTCLQEYPTVIGDLKSDHPLVLRAQRLAIRGCIEAPSIELIAGDSVVLGPQARVIAHANGTGGTITIAAPRVALDGVVDASGNEGGRIDVDSDRLLLIGRVSADGGDRAGMIRIAWSANCQQIAMSALTCTGSRGGSIEIEGGNGRSYLSGSVQACGILACGGRIDIDGRDVRLLDAHVDASGADGGGSVRIGARTAGATRPASDMVSISATTVLLADAREHGAGGTIDIWSEQRTDVLGSLSARGIGAEGGRIELSSAMSCVIRGTMDVNSIEGIPGHVLLDPKDIIISSAVGTLPQFDLLDPDPAPGNSFGFNVTPLDTGNVVVTAPGDSAAGANAGAIYLFNGRTGALISTFLGTAPNSVVNAIVTPLSNGNYLIRMPNWANGSSARAGAVTWGSGTNGVNGYLDATNSLLGSTTGDSDNSSVVLLTNGHYVVVNPHWSNGTASQAGAVTWGDGAIGVTGIISGSNSLVGTHANDDVGSSVTALVNGNIVIGSPGWSNGSISSAGAATWVDGSVGAVGAIDTNNSLYGLTNGDQIGHAVTPLSNGNYLVNSPYWSSGTAFHAGAVTWCNGAAGRVGAVVQANSLTGSQSGDQVGTATIALSNGNFVVSSSYWSNGAFPQAGAATWGNGATGIVGTVSGQNSLIGTHSTDKAGIIVTALANGNFVVGSPFWSTDSTGEVGAVTWGNGTVGITGAITTSNSLVGSNNYDRAGLGFIQPLSNGNYVIGSSSMGAITWANGTAPISGTISANNSLMGSGANMSITCLDNGNYVINSPGWQGLGAVTWGNGMSGVRGAISSANSLVGSGVVNTITSLRNGNYVVSSPNWSDGAAQYVGAVIWADGTRGITGLISGINSLIGASPGDSIGDTIVALTNGNYVVVSYYWSGTAGDGTGAVTWGDGVAGTTGIVSSSNSLVGTSTNSVVSSISPLSTGNYVIMNGGWGGNGIPNTGAATYADGSSGRTCDGSSHIDSHNSVIGGSSPSSMASGIESPGLLEFFIPCPNDTSLGGNGRVRVIFTDADVNHLVYSEARGQSIAIQPESIAHLLSSGTDVTLRASNDIVLDDAIVASASGGIAGRLILEAGRSIVMNAGISSGNGDVILIANDDLVNGVVDADRSVGNATITVTPSASIDAGSGTVNIDLRAGSGKTNSSSGDITVQTLTARSARISNHGTSPNSGISQRGLWQIQQDSVFSTANGQVAFNGTLSLSNGNIISSALNTLFTGAVVADLSGTGSIRVFGPADATGSTLSLSVNGSDPGVGTNRALISKDGAEAFGGAFASLPEASLISVNGSMWRLSYMGGDGNDVTVTKGGHPSIDWPAPAAIAFGTALSDIQLNARTVVPGTFVYSPSSGTIPSVGTTPLSVVFTPADGTLYTTASAAVPLTVLPAELLVSADDKIMLAGSPMPRLTATYSGFVGNDSINSLISQAVLTTPATSSSPPGKYPIDIANAVAPSSYHITYQSGTLTVENAGGSGAASAQNGGRCGNGSGIAVLIGILLVFIYMAMVPSRR